jgi:O-antigen/teichoic acid export membrane protein
VSLRSRYSAGLKIRLGRWTSGHNSHILDLVRGASIAGVLKALAALLAFGLSVVLGRALGADGAGVYFLALTTATVAATIGRVGLDSTVLRFIAAHASAGKWADVGKVYRTSVAISLAGCCLIAAILYFAADLLANDMFSDPSVATPTRLMALSVVPLALSVLISRALLGLSRIRDSLLVFSILPTGVALVGTWGLASQWGVNGAVMAYVVAVTVATLYGCVAWHRALLARSARLESRQHAPSPTRELLRSGVPLLIGALLQLVMQVSGTLMLGIWSDNSEVSQYTVAFRTAALISFVLVAVNTIAQPKFAELYARGHMEALAATAHKSTLLMTLFSAPVFLVFVFAPALVMSAFGSDFSGGAAPLRILSFGHFVNVATGSVGVLLVMAGQEREYRNVQVISALLVLALNVVLIPPYGAVGASISATVTLIVQNILFGYFVWTKLGILTLVPQSVVRRPVDGA